MLLTIKNTTKSLVIEVSSTPPLNVTPLRSNLIYSNKKKLRQQLNFRQVFKLLTTFGDAALLLRKPCLTGFLRFAPQLGAHPNRRRFDNETSGGDFSKPHTLGVIFSWHYGALAGNVDVLAFAKLEKKNYGNLNFL